MAIDPLNGPASTGSAPALPAGHQDSSSPASAALRASAAAADSAVSAASDVSAASAGSAGSAASAETRFDLDAYLRRIGFRMPPAAPAAAAAMPLPPPTLDTLREIVWRHPGAIPFENINPLLRWPVPLDAASLQQKLVHDRRGGWCFEHNLLLMHALRALGYRVTGLIGRVLWSQPDTAITARSHMLLRVELDDAPRIVDVGFGGMTLTGPLTIDPDIEQATPHEPYRLTRRHDDWFLQVRLPDQWKTLYRFTLQEQYQIDYEVSNWYLCTNPASHFLHGLTAARAAADRRYALRSRQLSEHFPDGRTERRILHGAGELRAVLEGPIGLTLPADNAEFEAMLVRIAAMPPPSTP